MNFYTFYKRNGLLYSIFFLFYAFIFGRFFSKKKYFYTFSVVFVLCNYLSSTFILDN